MSVPAQLVALTGQAALNAFALPFEITPILLTGGIATSVGGVLPIVALTEGANFIQSLIQGGNLPTPGNPNPLANPPGLQNFFIHYRPIAGSLLINNAVPTYPLANQQIAANAIIAQPLAVSMLAWCPAGPASGGYPLKLITMLSLQATLAQHNNTGGLYTVLTPSYIYTNCTMTGMRDVSGGETNQAQFAYQLDFFQPLVTVQAAQNAFNGLIQKLTDGSASSGSPTWSSGGIL